MDSPLYQMHSEVRVGQSGNALTSLHVPSQGQVGQMVIALTSLQIHSQGRVGQ
jgi:hypothetical protein